jgi:hypothetical protein
MEYEATITVEVVVKTKKRLAEVNDAIAKGIYSGLDIARCASPDLVKVYTVNSKTKGL